MSYTHISMFRFRNREQLETDRNFIQSQLEEFPKHIPSIQSYKLIRNHLSQPPLVSGSPLVFCDLIQIITFANEADLTAYPHDPYHMAHVRETTHLLERVCIIDYPSEDTPFTGGNTP